MTITAHPYSKPNSEEHDVILMSFSVDIWFVFELSKDKCRRPFCLPVSRLKRVVGVRTFLFLSSCYDASIDKQHGLSGFSRSIDLRSNVDLGFSRPSCIFLDAPEWEKHDSDRIVLLTFLVQNLYRKMILKATILTWHYLSTLNIDANKNRSQIFGVLATGASPPSFERGGQRWEVRRMGEPVRYLGKSAP